MESMREMIEQRAYFLYLKRGKINGHHAEDWKQAEKEIYAELEAKKKQDAQRQAPAKAQAEPVKPAEEPRPKSRQIVPTKPAGKTAKKRK